MTFDPSCAYSLFAQAAKPLPCGEFGMMPALIGIAVLFYFFMIRPQGAERKRRDEMLKNLKKNDRVVTIGGIHGVVANIQPDSDEVMLKVDETTNTKLRMSRSSIHQVITDETADGAPSK